MRYLVGLVLMVISLSVFGQEEKLIFGNTEKTSYDPDYTSKGKNKSRKTLILVRNNPKRVLEGNKCFKEYQQSIGVRVSRLTKGEPPYYNGISKWVNNTSTRFRGICWKTISGQSDSRCHYRRADAGDNVERIVCEEIPARGSFAER